MEKVKKKVGGLTDTLKNIEYFHIVKGNDTLLQFGEEINGITKTELQKKIGNALGNGQKNYVVKYIGDPQNKVGKIRAFSDTPQGKQQETDPNVLIEVNRRIQAIQDSVNNKNTGPDIQTLLSIKDSAYQIQIDFYKQRITQLENQIVELKKELNEAGEGSGGMLDQLLPVLLQALSKKPV